MSIPHQTIKNIMKLHGVSRVQDEAVDLLITYLQARIREATEKSRMYMEHAGRQTLYKSDMELALSILEKR
jgi:histone H3/H4